LALSLGCGDTVALGLSIVACGTTEERLGAPQDGGAPALRDGGIASVDATSADAGIADAVAPATDASADDAGVGDAVAASDAADAGGPERCVHRAPLDSKWKLAWSDEFDAEGAPDPASWGFERGFVRNQELQWYQPDDATVSGGLLTIAAQRQTVANPNYVPGSSDWKTNRPYAAYTSSSMTTKGKRSFEYGRFEACAKIDTRLGSWPAFWVLGDGRSWPSSGEVDVMEYYVDHVNANVCKPSGAKCDWSGSVRQSLAALGGATWSGAFHLWAMEWSSQEIDLSLDDVLVYAFPVASAGSTGTNPYTGNPFYILVNLAVGANGGDPTSTTFPITYQVDYVRVYQE
jgi:beta-glucanase (GH16 family)